MLLRVRGNAAAALGKFAAAVEDLERAQKNLPEDFPADQRQELETPIERLRKIIRLSDS
jgi:hypothetical protein